ncbi:hypothetical protein WA026_005720 [Henosepilachna vigintioctopunctata]|uniref:Major facilitator superfamily (MFS) profile domain-containing protein n=1 Tax=Henosepilachna vigintioctopunctata TaxID=420089 RepID=A0AAW1U1Y2_9CUCU
MDDVTQNRPRSRGMIRIQMYTSIFVASLLMIIRGSVIVWSSPMLHILKNEAESPLGRKITEDEASWLTSIMTIGEIVGSLTIGTASQMFGRKTLLTIICIPPLFFYVTLTFAKNIWWYFVARAVAGIGIGAVITLLPMYICELADPKIRGRLCVSMGIFKNIGTLLTYCTGPYIPFFWYHLGYSFLPLSFLILIFFFALESPYYIMKTDPKRAEESLREIRGKEDVSEEMKEMKRRLEKTSEGSFIEVFTTTGAKRALAIGLGLTCLSQLSGHKVVMSYSQEIFDDIGGSLTGDVENIILGSVEMVAKIFASGLTDKFRRKPQFMVSYFGAAFCHLTLGLFVVLKNNGADTTNFKWVPLFSLSCYFIVYDLGIGMLTQTLLGEIFPVRVKSVAISICDVNGNVVGFLTTLLFKRVQNAIGMGYTFWIFGAVALVALVFIKFVLKETSGKSLEQVQEELDEKNPNRTDLSI